MIIIDMYNIKSKINNFNELPFNIQNEICLKCSYIKIGFGVSKERNYLINPNNGIVFSGLLPYIITIFKKNNITYQINDCRIKPIKKFYWNIVNGFKLRDYQQRIVQAAVQKKRAVFQSCTSSGKALVLDTDVLTPNGWVKMRDIHIGDIIYDENGKETKVIGEYPQGLKDVYEITFQDGTKIKCCKDHLWKYTTRSSNFSVNKYKINTTEELLKYGIYNYSKDNSKKIYKFAIPVNKPVQFNKKDLTISPYLLGTLIGNDSLNINITSIPKEYLFSTVKNRLELARGLIDTNGTFDKNGYINFCTISKQLAKDFEFLIKSLGYRLSMIIDNKIDTIIYKYSIRLTDDLLFSSKKCQDKFPNKILHEEHNDILKIVDIKKLDEQVEMKCIAVDSPEHTYICEDFIVTHNTFIMTNIIKEFGVFTLVIAPKASLSVQLRNELHEFLGIKIGLINGNMTDYLNNNKICPIIVGTPQTLLKYPDILEHVEAVCIDECHNIPSGTIQKLLSMTKNAYYRIAVSATPWRDDGTDLLIDASIAPRNPKDTITASELINQGILTPIDINIFKCDSHCDWLGSYNDTYLKGIIYNNERNNMIIQLAKCHYMHHPTVILISRQEHGNLLLQKLTNEIENKIYEVTYQGHIYETHTIEFVSGTDSLTQREIIFQSIRENKTRIIIASTILDEGLDIKNLQCLIMAQGGCSSTRLFQRVGRVIRACPGKDKAYVYDFLDSNETLYSHSMTRLELMRMEPAWNIKIHDNFNIPFFN